MVLEQHQAQSRIESYVRFEWGPEQYGDPASARVGERRATAQASAFRYGHHPCQESTATFSSISSRSLCKPFCTCSVMPGCCEGGPGPIASNRAGGKGMCLDRSDIAWRCACSCVLQRNSVGLGSVPGCRGPARRCDAIRSSHADFAGSSPALARREAKVPSMSPSDACILVYIRVVLRWPSIPGSSCLQRVGWQTVCAGNSVPFSSEVHWRVPKSAKKCRKSLPKLPNVQCRCSWL